MSSCCDRALGALIASGAAAGGDPSHEVVYRQRIARLRQQLWQLWQFRRDQRNRPRGTNWLIGYPWRRSK